LIVKDLLRKSVFFNYEYYKRQGEGAFAHNDSGLRPHISRSHPEISGQDKKARALTQNTAHCIDILRQQLMCVMDVGLLGQVWWDRQEPKIFPDFNTKHKCRDFDAVRRWAHDHQAPDSIPLVQASLRPPRKDDILEDVP